VADNEWDRGRRRRQNVVEHVQDAVAITRFWKSIAPPDENGCCDWTGDTNKDGYGVFFWRGEKFGAHELVVTFTTGEVKGVDLDTCHSCDRPICCAEEHLRFDTRAANVRECVERGRFNPNRKSNDDLIELIRNRRFAGASVQGLARRYGFSKGWISEVCRGIRFPQAPGPISKHSGTGPKKKELTA